MKRQEKKRNGVEEKRKNDLATDAREEREPDGARREGTGRWKLTRSRKFARRNHLLAAPRRYKERGMR